MRACYRHREHLGQSMRSSLHWFLSGAGYRLRLQGLVWGHAQSTNSVVCLVVLLKSGVRVGVLTPVWFWKWLHCICFAADGLDLILLWCAQAMCSRFLLVSHFSRARQTKENFVFFF